ncbi:hypothetical protein NicSoilB8_03350 [Arthrobacter sp. NicSoilB8]|nr:hypothetical protein NicSoilB8_03350 [Arthrobacter sp. NicSoilB8]
MEVDDYLGARPEAAGAAHDMHEGGRIRRGDAAGNFESDLHGIEVHTDKHTQFMVQGVLQTDLSKSQLHNSAQTLRGCCPAHKPAGRDPGRSGPPP